MESNKENEEIKEAKENKAGVIALIFSFLFPIVGFICYFVNRKTVVNSSSYLLAAFFGILVNLFLRALAMS